MIAPKGPLTDNIEPDFSRLDKLNLEAARFNVRPKEEEDTDFFKADADKDFFSPVEPVSKSLFSRLFFKEKIKKICHLFKVPT